MFMFAPFRVNAYGVLQGEQEDVWDDVQNFGGAFAKLPLEITSYLLGKFCTTRSLCFLSETSMAMKKLVHHEKLLHKVRNLQDALNLCAFLQNAN